MTIAAKTSDDLIAEAKVLSQAADAEGRITDAEILEIGSHVLSMEIAELFISARQSRWVYTAADIATVSGQALYRVPTRALAAGVHDLVAVDTDGTEYDLHEVSLEEVHLYSNDEVRSLRGPYDYCWVGDQIRLLPTPSNTTYSLRLRFARQPARLVTVAECAKVASTTTTTVVCDSIPAGFPSSPTTVDIVEGTPHGDVLQHDASATYTGSTFTIAAGVDTEIAAEDYVCPVGTTCIPPIPEQVWPLLVAIVAHEMIDTFGDTKQLASSERRVARRREMAKRVLSPRNRGETPKIRNRHSAMRGGRYPGRR